MPWLIMFFSMSHLLYFHIQRIIYGVSSSEIDVSGSMMILIQRTTTYAWNLHDGQLTNDEIEDYQKENRVIRPPSLLGFLAYT